jgi:uncharacterized protein
MNSNEGLPPILNHGAPPPLPPGTTAPALPARPWGFWATLGLTAAVIFATMFVSGIVVGVAMAAGKAFNLQVSMEDLASNGLVLAIATCVSAPLGIGMTWLFTSMRPGLTARDYLAVRSVERRSLLFWCAAVLAYIAASDGLSFVLGKPIVPEFMDQAYRTAGFPPLLWLALVGAAPMSEELLFRGFCMTGISVSRLGNVGAVVVSSLIWALMHLQYDVYGIASIFVCGLLLGGARLKSGSTVTTMVMHALMNVVATMEVVAKAHWFPGA